MTEISRDELKQVFTEVLDEQRKKFWVDPETHYRQHQFVGSVMDGVCTIKKASLTAAAVVIVGAFLGLIWAAIKGSL